MMTQEKQTMDPPKVTTLMDASSDDFVATYLPLYSGGSQIKVQIGSPDNEYSLLKAILCKHSRYFAKMLDGPWEEGQDNTIKMDEMDGVVSVRSFKLLIQWCYIGKIVVSTWFPREEIETLVEFARLADFCQVEGMEEFIAARIKTLILKHPAPSSGSFLNSRRPDTNTFSITSQAVSWASGLPHGHAVRRIFAAATVEGLFQTDKHKFAKEVQEFPSFAVDVLNAVMLAIGTQGVDGRWVTFINPITGQILRKATK